MCKKKIALGQSQQEVLYTDAIDYYFERGRYWNFFRNCTMVKSLEWKRESLLRFMRFKSMGDIGR